MSDKLYLYAAREIVSGKLVNDITNPKRKYWDKKGNAVKAIDYYNNYYANRDHYDYNKGKHSHLELVTFELVEVEQHVDTDIRNSRSCTSTDRSTDSHLECKQ